MHYGPIKAARIGTVRPSDLGCERCGRDMARTQAKDGFTLCHDCRRDKEYIALRLEKRLGMKK